MRMVTQSGIKLAVHLVSSYFGDIIAKVCECLLKKGTLAYADIIRYTELNKETVRNSLLLLIQRNCVQAFAVQQEGGFEEAPKVVTRYMVLFDNIIHHLRFPKFLVMVSEELGKECEDILLALLEHGRLSMTQIIERHSENRSEEVADQDALQKNFNRLVEARFIERCPFHEPLVAPPSNEEIAEAKKRGAKAAKIMEVAKTLEQRALEAASPMDSLRFLVETFIESNDFGEDNKENSPSLTAGEKINMELSSVSGTKQKKEVLWRANFEEFVRRLRRKACVANVRSRFDDSAAVVLNAILQATRTAETKVKLETSVPLSMNDIFDEVIKSEHGLAMTLDHVRAALEQLGCQLPAIDIDETYSVDLRSIIELAQTEEVESIVLKRYGRDAYKIFRLLSKAGYLLETDKISDSTFIEKKDTARILLKLWKDDYVHMEKLEATAGKQVTFLLWKINKPLVWEHVLDEMYHAALNLKLRLAHELAKDKEILHLPKENRVGELKTRFDRMRKVRVALESSLINLDDSIMLFNDF